MALFAWASERITVPGIVALVGGLATLWCFLLPWFTLPASFLLPNNRSFITQPESALLILPGWNIAAGMPVPSGPTSPARIALFVHLWLIPVVAAALLVVAWYAAQRRVGVRMAAASILVLSAGALLVELGYAVEVTSFAQVMPSGVGVAWGCWLAVIVNLATAAVAVNLLRPDSTHTHAENADALSDTHV
jgi:hypothetical protein